MDRVVLSPNTNARATLLMRGSHTYSQRQIDHHVSELYGLTAEEIKIVEQGAA